MLERARQEWFSNIRGDLLSGIVVALALIPEAIAFSIIAGVDPRVGLYASFCIAVVIAFVGGRPGMISAATGAMALLMVTLVREHGLQYLLAATLLTGLFQIAAGYLRLGSLMRFVSRSVVTGFVNALAILIFMAQLPELTNVTWQVYAMTAAGLGIIYLFPLVPVVGKLLPSPLLCIVILTAVAITLGIDIRTVGDMGELPDTLPVFLWPDVPLNLETLAIIFPYSAGLAVVGLLESMMTAAIVDEMTDTPSDRNRECKGQGIANIGAGLLGGMAGCAMIGQSVINIKSGGRGRLSTFVAGTLLILMVVFMDEWIRQIPMAALVAVMIMVSIGTFSWESVRNLKSHPLSTNLVMVTTVAVVVATHNLALGSSWGCCSPLSSSPTRLPASCWSRAQRRRAYLSGAGPDLLCQRRAVPGRFRFQGGSGEGGHRPDARPLLGHHRHHGPRQGGHQVPPRGERGGGHRPERRQCHPGRSLCHPRQTPGGRAPAGRALIPAPHEGAACKP